MFYRGRSRDHLGRLIAEIHGFDFRDLEWQHDYIQWLFPLMIRSRTNPYAPVLEDEDRAAFHREAVIRKHFRVSLELMWEFYGFRDDGAGTLERTGRWEERRDNWLTENNHNHLRITRILRSSMLCGFIPEARLFLDALLSTSAGRPGVMGRAEEFWKTAVQTIPAPPGT